MLANVQNGTILCKLICQYIIKLDMNLPILEIETNALTNTKQCMPKLFIMALFLRLAIWKLSMSINRRWSNTLRNIHTIKLDAFLKKISKVSIYYHGMILRIYCSTKKSRGKVSIYSISSFLLVSMHTYAWYFSGWG